MKVPIAPKQEDCSTVENLNVFENISFRINFFFLVFFSKNYSDELFSFKFRYHVWINIIYIYRINDN